ncbi:MAG: hypothetical protein IJS90_04895 [Clostridia bacterium]|nr:hypothetical protein [Clostridia bacterium]
MGILKKLISVLMAVIMVISVIPSAAMASGAQANSVQTPESSDCEHVNTELLNACEASCTEAGYTGDIYCLDCEKVISDGDAIEPIGHNYEFVEIEPDCYALGYTGYICSVCGEAETGECVPHLGHFDENGDNICDRCEADMLAVYDTSTFIGWWLSFLHDFIFVFMSLLSLFV